jgi:hypothetical protein
MSCKNCASWVVERKRVYADGYEAVDFIAGSGVGECAILKISVPADFSCAKFEKLNWSHVVVEKFDGEPWQHWRMGDCPDCQGRGSGKEGGVCGRCAGTGHVRYYADGYVGEERTRRHPSEPEAEAGLPSGSELAPMKKPDIVNSGSGVV